MMNFGKLVFVADVLLSELLVWLKTAVSMHSLNPTIRITPREASAKLSK
jgi:hypothetical protein